MREFLKENQKLLACAALGLVVGVFFGLAIPTGSAQQETPEPETAPVGRIGIVSIVPETALRFHHAFSGCAHGVDEMPSALPYVGQTREEFQTEFPDGRIDVFSASEVELFFVHIGACPQHVMLKAGDLGQLHVYQANSETLAVESLQSLPLYAEAFDAGTAEELYEGIVFDTVDQVNEYLENVES